MMNKNFLGLDGFRNRLPVEESSVLWGNLNGFVYILLHSICYKLIY